jgi:hypothetical protein
VIEAEMHVVLNTITEHDFQDHLKIGISDGHGG